MPLLVRADLADRFEKEVCQKFMKGRPAGVCRIRPAGQKNNDECAENKLSERTGKDTGQDPEGEQGAQTAAT